ncbi:MAG: DegT/DnrJ/EryC1/StrS family aminotransferase [Vicinamibacterales bacterium]
MNWIAASRRCVLMPTSSQCSSRSAGTSRTAALARCVSKTGEMDGRHLAGAGAVASLEARLARHFGMRYALAVSSATTGMLALALATEVRGRDIVAPAFAHGGGVAGWLLTGNAVRCADVEPATMTLSPRAAAACITARTAVVLGVDWFGTPADAQALRRVADEHGVLYVSDAAQALSASRDGKAPGWCADAVVVSFTTGKVLDVGEGGAVLTNRPDLYERLVWHTQHPHRQHRDVSLRASNTFSINGRIHPVAAALADYVFDDAMARARRRSARLRRFLAAMVGDGIIEATPLATSDIGSGFFRVPVACRGKEGRAQFLAAAARRGMSLRHDPAPLRPLYAEPAIAHAPDPKVVPPAWPAAERLMRRLDIFSD